MRNRFLIGALIVIGLLAFWWIASRNANVTPMNAATSTIPQARKESPKPALLSQTIPPQRPPLLRSSEAPEKAFITAFKTPIAFYGRVIDQHGIAVSEADVKLSANDKPFGGRPSEYTRKTDVDGRFSIGGIAGITLAVEVSKPGYRGIPWSEGKPSSSGLFEYSVSEASVRGAYRVDENNPTIFVLYKPGPTEPLVKVGEKNFRIARDGSPLSIPLDGQGAHQMVLRCWNQELQRPAGQRQYDWQLEVSVPDGGLAVREDPFKFEAPEDGYIANDIVNMPAALGNKWRSFAERSYFIRFNDQTFARASLRMRAGGDHFVVWESFLNPKPGSRNLESDATISASAQELSSEAQ